MIRKNKWWIITAYCLVALLVVLIVVSCLVKINKKPEIKDPYSYEFLVDGNTAEYPFMASLDNNKDKYDEINKIFNDSFSESLIVSLFSGRIGYNNRIEPYTSKPATTGYILYLDFGDAQKIMRNGKEYTQTSYSRDPIYYERIIVLVSQGQGMTTHYFYYECDPSLNEGWTGTSKKYYRQSFVANFDALYDYLTETQN